MNLPIKTIADIRALDPCYDPSEFAPEDWQGTALDVLRAEQVPPQDRLWVVLHDDWIDDKTRRLFTVWCVQELEVIKDPYLCNVIEELSSAKYNWHNTWMTVLRAARATSRYYNVPWRVVRDAQVNYLIDLLTVES